MVSLYHPFPMTYCTFLTFTLEYWRIITSLQWCKYRIMDKSDILTYGNFSMVLIFSFLLSNIFSKLVLDLSIIFYYYYYNILQYIHSFVYLLNYLLESSIYLFFFFSINFFNLILCILHTIFYKSNWNK